MLEEAFRSIKLDKKVPVPLYYQLKRQILTLIEAGSVEVGDMLPPENELCDVLQVSRPTIRQALGELVAEGFLDRYKGKGTFVSRPKVDARFFNRLETFQSEMVSKGFAPRTVTLALKKLTFPHEAHERLRIPRDSPLIYLDRLRFIDDTPLVHVETFLPFEPYQQLMEVDFSTNSLYDSLERIYGVRIDHAHREIEAVNATAKEAQILQSARNKALGLVKTVAYSGAPPAAVEFSVARYRGDLNQFSVDVYR
jgi:GntR family transcriptional regulator